MRVGRSGMLFPFMPGRACTLYSATLPNFNGGQFTLYSATLRDLALMSDISPYTLLRYLTLMSDSWLWYGYLWYCILALKGPMLCLGDKTGEQDA